MLRRIWSVVFLGTLLTASFGSATENAAAMNARIGRGINLGNALEAPDERAWGVRLEERYFDLIKEVGFDSVRIPCRWSAHSDKTPPYRIDPEFLKRVDWAIKQTLSRGMIAVVNVHHFSEFMDAPAQEKARLLGIWKQLAERYRNHPRALCFELLNEPTNKVDPVMWNQIQKELISLIRRTNPERTLFVAPTGWNRIDRLHHLELPAHDGNLIVSVHYYDPFRFTHQGASWVKAGIPVGTPWVGTEEDKAAVRADLDVAMRWSKENKVPVNVGEFGVYGKADMESRVRWTSFLRAEMEKRSMSWHYWEFCAGFGIYDRDQNVWRKELLNALVPPE